VWGRWCRLWGSWSPAEIGDQDGVSVSREDPKERSTVLVTALGSVLGKPIPRGRVNELLSGIRDTVSTFRGFTLTSSARRQCQLEVETRNFDARSVDTLE
jgi:hypothetical protein